MIHARTLGESFGLSVCESLFYDRPVLSWEKGHDLNHVEILKDTGLLYNRENLEEKIMSLPSRTKEQYRHLVEPFSGVNVMPQFEKVFID